MKWYEVLFILAVIMSGAEVLSDITHEPTFEDRCYAKGGVVVIKKGGKLCSLNDEPHQVI